MRLEHFPLYCGGKLLTGLYTSPYGIDWLMPYIKSEQKTYNDYMARNSTSYSNYHYVPNTLLGFQQALRYLTHLDTNNNWENVGQGIIIAITNPAQIEAAKYLHATGFKNGGVYNKHNQENWRNDKSRTAEGWCTLWIGDWWGGLGELLSKVEPWKDPNEKKSKFVRC